ncbi:GspH/FimT family pseudopilin [Luteimonas dalianensis]|uniref:GspH/FimT family pseudopilin n=1 Tax=Luteimonas dalianensis TaxID=1148196 RepID=UPI003BF374CB
MSAAVLPKIALSHATAMEGVVRVKPVSRKPETNQRSAGYSLVELLVTTTILTLLLAVASPMMSSLLRNSQLQSTIHTVASGLAVTRMAAIHRGHPVTMCPSADGSLCSGSNDWSSGWIVYLDRQRTTQPASMADILEVSTGVPDRFSLTSNTGRTRIRYQPTGWSAGSNLTLTLCAREGTPGARVIVNNAGRARVERGAHELWCQN